jgi:3-(3-hydroxy-phenyl)propionate hydroxylase
MNQDLAPERKSIEFDVVVVGGGPTGVTLGLLLARNGVRTIVIDKEPDIYPLPRAAHIDHETVRIFQELGVAGAVMASCRSSSRYDFLTANGEVLLRFEGLDRMGPGGWPAGNMVHQPSIEAVLRGAARTQERLTFRTGWNWVSYGNEGGSAVSMVETPEGRQIIRSRFVIGADGSRSPVRRAAGIELDDLGFDERWLVIDTIVHDAERLPKNNLQICDPARPTTCVLMGSGRHRWEFMLKPGETAEQVSDDNFIARLLKPWKVEGAVTLERKAVYQFNGKVARTWRKGSILLAGDAAHLTPPFAGQGLCSGLRDAANLAWKLAAVHRGAGEALLDTYQAERDAHVRFIIEMAIMMGRTVCITDPEAARLRDEKMLASRASGPSPDGSLSFPPLAHGCLLEGVSAAGSYFPQAVANQTDRLDDVLGPGAWLISRSPATGPGTTTTLRRVALDDFEIAPFKEQLKTWLTKHSADAVLVRPDRYVFGAGAAEALQGAWATVFQR